MGSLTKPMKGKGMDGRSGGMGAIMLENGKAVLNMAEVSTRNLTTPIMCKKRANTNMSVNGKMDKSTEKANWRLETKFMSDTGLTTIFLALTKQISRWTGYSYTVLPKRLCYSLVREVVAASTSGQSCLHFCSMWVSYQSSSCVKWVLSTMQAAFMPS